MARIKKISTFWKVFKCPWLGGARLPGLQSVKWNKLFVRRQLINNNNNHESTLSYILDTFYIVPSSAVNGNRSSYQEGGGGFRGLVNLWIFGVNLKHLIFFQHMKRKEMFEKGQEGCKGLRGCRKGGKGGRG